MKIQVKDYCNIENLTIEIPCGFTCITGSSMAGKSSLMSAIRALVYNKHSDAKIRQGQDFYAVGIIDGDNKVLCKRNKSKQVKTAYQVNGEAITKVGRNAVPEVQEALGIKDIEILKSKTELNFCKQFAYPFLLDKTPSQLYEFLASSDTSDDLNSIIKTMKSDLKGIVDRQKRLEGSIDMAKSAYETEHVKFNNLNGSEIVTNAILGKSGEVNKLQSISQVIKDSEIYGTELREREKLLSESTAKLDALKGLEDLIDEHEKNQKLKDSILTIAQIQKEGHTLQEEYKKLQSLDIDLSKIDVASYLERKQESVGFKLSLNKCESLIEQEQYLANKCANLDRIEKVLDLDDVKLAGIEGLERCIDLAESTQSKIDVEESELAKLNAELEAVNKELAEFDVCPYCDSKLK